MSPRSDRGRTLARHFAGLSRIHDSIAEDAGIAGQITVRCRTCGAERQVDGAEALRSGWPKCHGATMALAEPARG